MMMMNGKGIQPMPMGEGLMFSCYKPMMVMIDKKLAEKIIMKIKNIIGRIIKNGKMKMMCSIPKNMLLAEVSVTPEVDFELEMLPDGMVMITMNVPEIAPMEEYEFEFNMYYAGEMVSPSYSMKNELALYVDDDMKTDEVAADSVLKIQVDAFAG